ncbi:MAG: Fic family protein, partial [Clostridiales bacterium]|nr:Fic family protein [Clostridiales bacterium]
EHLKNIHKYIFQDIYEWAGKLRTVDIAKGNNLFALERHLEYAANYVFTALKKENNLIGVKANVEQYADRLAFHAGEINMLHPFREGNGRSLREFLRCLAKEAGYEINWVDFDRDSIYNSFVKSSVDHVPLKKEFKNHFLENERKWYVSTYSCACLLSSETVEKCIRINRTVGKKQNLRQLKNLRTNPAFKNITYDVINDFKVAAIKHRKENSKKMINKIDLEL